MDGLKEKIRYYTEWICLLWVGMFVIGGGVTGLLLALDSRLKAFLFVSGIILQVVFAVVIGIIHNRVTALIERLEGTQ